MKKNVTELVFILDRSGSMSGLENDTIGGFNSLIDRQRDTEGRCYVSTVLFNGSSQVLHDRVNLSNIPRMTKKDYIATGSTALLDAVGKTIKHISDIHRYSRPEDVPERTMFVITTDGYENSSHCYTVDQIKRMISRKKKKFGWEFLFLGANIDAVKTAARYGIGADRAADYNADGEGIFN